MEVSQLVMTKHLKIEREEALKMVEGAPRMVKMEIKRI